MLTSINSTYSSTLSLISALDEVGGQGHAYAALHPEKRPGAHCTGTWCALHWDLVRIVLGLRAGIDGCAKFSPFRYSILRLSSLQHTYTFIHRSPPHHTHTHTHTHTHIYILYIHIGLKFSNSRTGSHVRYSCHHKSSRFTFPIFVYSWCFSVFHSLQSITPRIQ